MAKSRRVMNAFIAATAVALLTGSAAAQSLNMPMGDSKSLTDEEKEKQAERERAYKDAVRKIPDQKANTDPWGNVRNAGSAQSNQQSNQKKTGSNTSGSNAK